MVSSGQKTLWQPLKKALAIMEDLTGFAVHQRWSADDFPSKDFADGLVAEADPQYRDRCVKAPNDVFSDPGIRWCAGPGGNDNTLGFQALNFFERDLVVAEDAQLFAQFPKVLHEVVGERIVVIDNQNHIF